MKPLAAWPGAALALALLGVSCTMQKQEAPDLSGPSEFATALSIAISPDVLQQDGVSESLVTVTARGPSGAPLPNLPLRAEILVDRTPADFGALSSRTPTTGADGRATLAYRAPQPVAGVAISTIVEIAVTPIGSDYKNASARFASIRLVPPGIVLPPSGLQAVFSFTPSSPTANQTVLFDASESQAPASNPIASYQWEFGNGRSASGRTATNQYDAAGTYVVRLTIMDGFGRTAERSQSVTVAAGANPTAAFVYSPTDVRANQQVFFNATSSTAAPGRRIVSHAWDMGDGSAQIGEQMTHTYTRAATFVVTLTVTDDAGRKATVSRDLVVAP
jgi:PKD repeat protein